MSTTLLQSSNYLEKCYDTTCLSMSMSMSISNVLMSTLKAPNMCKVFVILRVLIEGYIWCNWNVIFDYFDTLHISKLRIQCRSEPQWGWDSEAISCPYSYLHSWWLGILLPWTCCWYGFTGVERLFADIFFLSSSRMILLFISSKQLLG